jgi:hypothetical protein
VEGRYSGEGLVWFEVPEGEARDAVFKEGGSGFERESAGAAGYCSVVSFSPPSSCGGQA